MRPQVAWFGAAVLFGVLGGAAAAGLDETTVTAQLSAADHEADEGYFTVGEGATLIAKPGSELHRWLAAHRGQKVRLVVEGARDGLSDPDPDQKPGIGRDTGAISWRLP